ncbi:helix-turn-helix transcriptional regulator [Clostridium botulinum]|uniref:helix-turn-helix transcriptional regulator n=1 Tax=Clostridium botulinum TaxID=1491 RepID=UPI0007735F4E|nr:helix-turn-helix transcriptional regulator [Clostridium botulinum]NFF80412.1 helix-turn-helix transcriptional regulator [Clostridium botulinum]NFH80811.1 helix-turn-helix transcriptional regulator [Clostridium botulinum]NFH83188.1 helix-turn-helix transcriptional regulator [Clostridium botulinum]NFI12053.1 helix-turn-helix transcriptional regulator [Clostridium botulinum]NFI15798.1 helix-turn-helix transcriptional regulator [Clostridium botulinum]
MNNLIKEYRKRACLTQQYMADKLGMAVSAYNMIENGKRGISLINAKKISILLNTSIDELFFSKIVHK